VFVREVVATSRVADGNKLPALVYFTGGPGFESPRPVRRTVWFARPSACAPATTSKPLRASLRPDPFAVAQVESGGWIGAAVEKFRVLLLVRACAVRRAREVVHSFARWCWRGLLADWYERHSRTSHVGRRGACRTNAARACPRPFRRRR